VLDPARRDIDWLYEHTPRGEIGWRRAWGTLARTLLPWRFWRRVDISSRLSAGRLTLWLVVLILPMQGMWSGASGLRTWIEMERYSAGYPQRVLPTGFVESQLVQSLGHPLIRVPWTGGSVLASIRPAAVSYTFVVPLGAGLLMPVLLLVLARSRATSKIHAAHVMRAGVYGLAWIAWWYLVWTLVTAGATVGDAVFSAAGPQRRTALPMGVSVGGVGTVAVLLCLVWFGAWWWCAIRIGFRLSRPRLVWSLLMIACLLMGLVLATFDRWFLTMMGQYVG